MRENNDELDALWREAVTWVAERGEASTSMLQRKFSIGFQRASRLLDTMEARGIVGPKDGARPRQVLITATEAEYIAEGNEFGGGPSIDIDPF
jgi:S-DNA-T family DNA segregation ATPase FtsK/SpoIIIE